MRIRLKLVHLLPTVIVLSFAIAGNVRHRSRIADVTAQRDSAQSRLRNYAIARRDAAFAGDSLFDGMLVDAQGASLSMRALYLRGYRNFYFYREDCEACAFLSPLLQRMPTAVAERTAFIQYHPTTAQTLPSNSDHFSWVPDSSAPRRIASVPALVIVGNDGRLVSAADFETEKVVALMDLHGLLRRSQVDSVGRSRVTQPPDSSVSSVPLPPRR